MKSKMKSTESVFSSKAILVGVFALFLLGSCAKQVSGPAVVYNGDVKNYTSEVNVDSKISSDSYVLLSNGEGTSVEDAINQAERNAFSVLLFSGIANSDLNYPLVENESESVKANESFYDNFFQKNDFRRFISAHSMVSNSPSFGNRTQVKMRITVNLGSLKSYLVQNSITRKFGL